MDLFHFPCSCGSSNLASKLKLKKSHLVLRDPSLQRLVQLVSFRKVFFFTLMNSVTIPSRVLDELWRKLVRAQSLLLIFICLTITTTFARYSLTFVILDCSKHYHLQQFQCLEFIFKTLKGRHFACMHSKISPLSQPQFLLQFRGPVHLANLVAPIKFLRLSRHIPRPSRGYFSVHNAIKASRSFGPFGFI